MFSYISPEARIPARHPLRKIRELVREVLGELNRSLGKLYASEGRPSIPPEQLLSALLLQVFYGIRSERQLMEQLDYNFFVPLVRGAFAGRSDLGPDHLHEIRLGIREFNPKLKRAAGRLDDLRTPEGEPIPPNTLAEPRRDMERQ